jgi:hypothetical protein
MRNYASERTGDSHTTQGECPWRWMPTFSVDAGNFLLWYSVYYSNADREARCRHAVTKASPQMTIAEPCVNNPGALASAIAVVRLAEESSLLCEVLAWAACRGAKHGTCL